MISVQSVSLTLNGKALLSDVSLDCQPGTLTALVGPNGAGKSTLLSLIAADRQPDTDTGEISINDLPLAKMSIRQLAQERSVFPQGAEIRFGYPVREVVAMGRAFRDLPPDEEGKVIKSAMSDAEIDHLSERNAQTLSGGEQARTTFARVLAQETPVVLLDEPTAALDLRHQERLLKQARAMAESGATVIAVLHDLNLAAGYSDQIALLENDKLRKLGSPWEVLTQSLIADVYKQEVCVFPHPQRDCPVVLSI